ncbi:MAG: flagellar biosynthesis protein FlhF, partial [Kangiellaceae bacterium]|nr:flagellar biosynthesis protein FlhF [Kangiellaceae bacterium]
MKIRRFFAKDMRTAINQVSSELGADAAILSSTKVNGGVEVVAATDYDDALLQARASSNKPDYHKEQGSQPTGFESGTETQLKSYLQQQQTDSTSRPATQPMNISTSDSTLSAASKAQASSENSAQLEQSFPSIEWSQEPTLLAMREELNLLRNLLQEQVSKIAWDKRKQDSPIAVALEQELLTLGLSNNIIEPIVAEAEFESDFECAWQRALALIAKQMDSGEDDIITKGGVIAFVGPTGVGKTTTLAKLAARHVLQYGSDSVALITTDSYRIAAHDQIKTFARLLQVPVHIANDAASVSQALKKYADKRLVLIDTAGMSHNDERMMQQIHCINDHRSIESYLVLSATAQNKVLQDAINLFKSFNLSGCVITKLDEAASLGEIISTIINNKLKIMYTTDGQRVPEDIRNARAHHLVSKMVWLTRNQSQHSDNQAT